MEMGKQCQYGTETRCWMGRAVNPFNIEVLDI